MGGIWYWEHSIAAKDEGSSRRRKGNSPPHSDEADGSVFGQSVDKRQNITHTDTECSPLLLGQLTAKTHKKKFAVARDSLMVQLFLMFWYLTKFMVDEPQIIARGSTWTHLNPGEGQTSPVYLGKDTKSDHSESDRNKIRRKEYERKKKQQQDYTQQQQHIFTPLSPKSGPRNTVNKKPPTFRLHDRFFPVGEM